MKNIKNTRTGDAMTRVTRLGGAILFAFSSLVAFDGAGNILFDYGSLAANTAPVRTFNAATREILQHAPQPWRPYVANTEVVKAVGGSFIALLGMGIALSAGSFLTKNNHPQL